MDISFHGITILAALGTGKRCGKWAVTIGAWHTDRPLIYQP